MSLPVIPSAINGQIIENINGEPQLIEFSNPLVISGTRVLAYNPSNFTVYVRSTHVNDGGEGSDNTQLPTSASAAIAPKSYVVLAKRSINTHAQVVLDASADGTGSLILYPYVS